METGSIIESAEGHGRSDFGSGKGAAATGILQEWREKGMFGGGEAHTSKGRGKAGNFGMLGRI